MSPANTQPRKEISLFRWTWRSYARTALVPLLMVELLLVVAYFTTNALTRSANIAAVRASAEVAMDEVARLNTGIVAERLQAVAAMTDVLRGQVRDALSSPLPVDPDQAARFAFDDSGVAYYTPEDDGTGGAGFYSGRVPVTPEMQDKAAALAAIDPILRDIQQSSTLVVQTYFNTWDSYNRIYPFFDTLEVYAPRLDIPAFNFYYEADPEHNPSGGVVWTDAYVDPAGQGWLLSAIAPVMVDDFLEGVVGVDITLNTIVERVLNITTPWGGFAVLLDRNGTILAMPPSAERALGLQEVSDHTYAEAVNTNTFKPEDYSLDNVPALTHLPIIQQKGGAGEARLNDEQHLVAWNVVEGPGWHLAVFVPEPALFAAAAAVGDRFDRVGIAMVAALIIFYVAFFTVLYGVARRNAARMAAPLEGLTAAAGGIADGDFRQRVPPSDILEIGALGRAVVEMGRQLGEKTDRLMGVTRSLEESDAFRRSLIENLPVPVVFFGETPDVVLTRNAAYDALVSEHGQEAVCGTLAAAASGSTDADVTLALGDPPRRFTGRVAHVTHRGTRGALCVLLDVTVQEEARARIAEARDRAIEAARLKSEFLAKVTHELRTPLNGIIGLADLAEGEKDAGRVRSDVRAIGRSARSLLGIVEDLLDLSAIESGHITLDATWFAPARMAEDVLAGFRLQAREKGLELQTDMAPLRDASVHGPGGRIRQVVTNLVGNAVKFTHEGAVRVAGALRHENGRTLLEMVVEDTGVGIAAERVGDIFDPFRQGDDGLARRFPGIGLGLAISRDLATRMGGSLTVWSEPGRGTRFTLTVPVTPQEATTGAPDPAGDAPGRCLLLGFDGVNEALVQAIMGSRGAAPRPVGRPDEALAALRSGDASAALVRVTNDSHLEVVRDLLSVGPQAAVAALVDEDAPAPLFAALRRLAVPTVAQPVTAAKIAWALDQLAKPRPG